MSAAAEIQRGPGCGVKVAGACPSTDEAQRAGEHLHRAGVVERHAVQCARARAADLAQQARVVHAACAIICIDLGAVLQLQSAGIADDRSPLQVHIVSIRSR